MLHDFPVRHFHAVHFQRPRSDIDERTDQFAAGFVERAVQMGVAVLEWRRTLGLVGIGRITECVVACRRTFTRHFQSDRVVVR